jgi:hypothetical protein
MNDKEHRTNIINWLSNRKHSGYAVFGKDDVVNAISNGGAGWNSYESFINYLNNSIAKVFLGGTMLIEDGSSRSQSEVHERQTQIFINSKRRFIESVINTKYLPMLGIEGREFKWDLSETLNLKELADVISKMSNYNFDATALTEKYGIEITKNENNTGNQGLLARIQNEIPEITNISSVSVVGRLCDAFAIEAYITEQNCLMALKDISNEANTLYVGNLQWYANQAKLFQYGDTLELIDNVWQYQIIDETKRIVKLAAASNILGQVQIKVAKNDVDGLPIPLESAEVSALESYFEYKGGAGEIITITTKSGDPLKIIANIYVDSQKILSSGKSTIDSNVYPVEVAINDYLKALPFDGIIYVSELIDKIMDVDGVYNIKITTCQAYNSDTLAYSEILNTAESKYETLSGYLIEDPNNLFRNTLTYI